MQTVRQDMVPPLPRQAEDLPHLQNDILGHAEEKIMKIAFILLTLSLPLLVAFPCSAQYVHTEGSTGAELQRDCASDLGSFGYGYCIGLAWGAMFAGVEKGQVCTPDGVTFGQAEKVLTKYL